VEQQGPTEGFRREEALTALAELSIAHPPFLSGLRGNLEFTLWRYGFALSPREMQEARNYLAAYAELSDEEILENLRSVDRRWW
jgi:hypothetical protein